MQSLENVRIVVLKKNPWWCTFLILANKALHDYSFPVIFSNISEGLFLKTYPDRCFWNFFRSTEAVTRKKGCSEKSEKILKKTSVGLYNFLILPNKNTPKRMVFGKFVKYFKTAILKNNSERLLLRFSVKATLSYIKMRAAAPTQSINRKGLSQSGFTENVTKFSGALN